MNYSVATETLLRWANATHEVRAVVLTGSAAVGRPHPLSDRDIELYVRDSAPLLAEDSWWRSLGDVIAVEALENADGHDTRLIYYAGGKLDFTIIPVAAIARVEHDRPFVVLLDKDGVTSALHVDESDVGPPSQEEFDEAMNWAWAAALMAARAIARDEPWSAKVRDHDLKSELLRVVEWDHQARHGTTLDVRYAGTRMRTWMDSDVQERLTRCWAGFPLPESTVALSETMELFVELATRTADSLALDGFAHQRAIDELERILGCA